MKYAHKGILAIALSVVSLSISFGQSNEGREFKIDLSNQVASEASGLAEIASEKKSLGLKWLEASRELDNYKIFNQYIFEIKSFKYEGDSLFVSYRANLNQDKADVLWEKARFIQEFGIISKLKDKKTSLANYSAGVEPSSYDLGMDRAVSEIALQTIAGSRSSVAISFLDGDGKEVISQEIQRADINKLWENLILGLSLDTERAVEKHFDFKLEIKLKRQDATRIKSIKFNDFSMASSGDTVASVGREWARKVNLYPLLSSLNSSSPIPSYEHARDKLVLVQIDMVKEYLQYQKNLTSNGRKSLYIYALYAITKAYVADNVIVFSILQNSTDQLLLGFAIDHSSLFRLEIIAEIIDGKRQFAAKSGETGLDGCARFIPEGYQYSGNNSSFNPVSDNNVNTVLNQMGLLNNTVTLSEPDKKTRVIVGRIESLTGDGGIIRNNGKYQDDQPVVYTRTSKTVVISPEKISVGNTMIRIIGTYDKNSKIKLSNRLGSTRIIDAANISVVCMEPLYNDADLVRMLFGN